MDILLIMMLFGLASGFITLFILWVCGAFDRERDSVGTEAEGIIADYLRNNQTDEYFHGKLTDIAERLGLLSTRCNEFDASPAGVSELTNVAQYVVSRVKVNEEIRYDLDTLTAKSPKLEQDRRHFEAGLKSDLDKIVGNLEDAIYEANRIKQEKARYSDADKLQHVNAMLKGLADNIQDMEKANKSLEKSYLDTVVSEREKMY